jgi:hypothetical protein
MTAMSGKHVRLGTPLFTPTILYVLLEEPPYGCYVRGIFMSEADAEVARAALAMEEWIWACRSWELYGAPSGEPRPTSSASRSEYAVDAVPANSPTLRLGYSE